MTLKTARTLNALAACGALGLALAVPAGAQAQDLARVIASVPVIQQVAVPRQVCSTQQVMVEQPKSGAGALLGALAGGAAGNAIGDGSGRAAATAIGIFGGAILGNRIEGSPGARMQDQTTCTTQTVYESRTVGYQVTYEYAGRQYQVQLPHDPGPTIRVQVTPMAPTQTMQAPLESGSVTYATSAAPARRIAVVQPAPVQVQVYGVQGVQLHAGRHGHHGYHGHPGHYGHLHLHRDWR